MFPPSRIWPETERAQVRTIEQLPYYTPEGHRGQLTPLAKDCAAARSLEQQHSGGRTYAMTIAGN
jgi:hypothetical protein